jgi:hypothetical protein
MVVVAAAAAAAAAVDGTVGHPGTIGMMIEEVVTVVLPRTDVVLPSMGVEVVEDTEITTEEEEEGTRVEGIKKGGATDKGMVVIKATVVGRVMVEGAMVVVVVVTVEAMATNSHTHRSTVMMHSNSLLSNQPSNSTLRRNKEATRTTISTIKIISSTEGSSRNRPPLHQLHNHISNNTQLTTNSRALTNRVVDTLAMATRLT